MMRVAALGFHHESNTFAPVPASLARFLEAGPVEGDGLVGEHGAADTTLAGFLAAGAADPDVELVPLVYFDLNPMGAITAEAFEHMARRLLVALGERGPWDAVLLAMHGAAVSEGFPDADGEMVRRVRSAVGSDVIVGVAYDMHANVTEAMVHHADIVNTYLTNPHVDARQRAAQLAAQVFDVARGSIRPCSALVRIPIAVNILRQGTSDVPMRQLMEVVRTAEALPGVLSVSLAEGFPYADVAEMGMSVIAVTDDDAELAASVASGIAREVWANRQQLCGTGTPIHAGLSAGAAHGTRPVVLLDVGDNVGAGSPADSTHVLAASQQMGVKSVFGSLCDPGAVQACWTRGLHAAVDIWAGGRTDDLHGQPIRLVGRVTHLDDGRFEDPGPTHGGRRVFDAGRRAVVRTDDGLVVLLTSRPMGNTSRAELTSAGIDPSSLQIVIAKGVHSPRAAFEPLAARMIQLDSPGCTTADIATLTYLHRVRPIFPFEPEMDFEPCPLTRGRGD